MSFPATIAQAILDTVIGRLAPLFLSGAVGDMTTAREAARQMLAAHRPETPDELALAAEIVSLQFHTLEALSSAADPELPLNKILRLRGSAVSLSRESHKARRKLDLSQRNHRAAVSAPPAETPPAETPKPQSAPAQAGIDKAMNQIEATRATPRIARQIGGETWLDAYQKRQAADNLKKNQPPYALPNAPAHLSAINAAAALG